MTRHWTWQGQYLLILSGFGLSRWKLLLFIYSDVNNFVVVSTCQIIVSSNIVLIDDSEVNLYFSHECCGWRHLTAYYVVRMNNWKSIDTTV